MIVLMSITSTIIGFQEDLCLLHNNLCAGYPSNVSSSEPLVSYPTWQSLLAAPNGGYSFDKQAEPLWLKLLTSNSANITLA